MIAEQMPATDSWLIIIFFIALGLFAYVRMNYPKRLSQLFKAALNMGSAREIMREENPLGQRASIILSIIFLLLMPVLIYQAITIYHPEISNSSGIVLYLKITGILLLIYALKLIVLRATGIALKANSAVSEYTFNIFLLSQVSGLFILPIVVLLTYSLFSPAPLLAIGFLIFLFAYIVRIFRGFGMSLGRPGLSSLHLFYYFCALELVPAIILTKVYLLMTAHN